MPNSDQRCTSTISSFLGLILLFPICLFSCSASIAQENQAELAVEKEETEPNGELHFAFSGAKWRDVIDWLAESSELALHVGDLPTGSFTYSDSTSFTTQEAIDRINLFLLPEGYTLVRSGRLLSVLNLGDPRSLKQLDALARLVDFDQLEKANDNDVVKCLFPLGELTVEDAIEELGALNLMKTPAMFSKTNQLMITDTAAKLKTAKKILSAFQPNALDNGTVVKSFKLQHVDAEDVLLVARPHLGLATGEMIGIDVSLSADVKGENIYVTGIEDKVKLIEGLIASIDKPKKDLSATSGDAELRSHVIESGNVEIVYNVLQTLLAGKSVRLSMDKTAGTVVALATPDIQKEIEQTVAELKASEAEFEVIPLKAIDPYFAIGLLEEMLDLPDLSTTTSSSRGEKPTADPNIPKIDADPGNMRLFVRAKRHQIEQIKKIVAGLDAKSTSSSSDLLRVFPLKGKFAQQVLVKAARFWRSGNPILFYPSGNESKPETTERVLTEETKQQKPDQDSTVLTIDDIPKPQLLTENPKSEKSAIRCQLTSRGLILQSEDSQALDQLEKLLQIIVGPTDSIPSRPVVFYLKYTKPDDAIRMLAELLDGGESAKGAEGETLVSGSVSGSSDTFLGSIVTSSEGTTTMMAGSITVVADARLNRLIAQGTATDIENIEAYLKIVDKDTSLTLVETYGSSHVIALEHVKASEVAVALRAAYSGRVSGESSTGESGKPTSSSAAKAAELARLKASANSGAKRGQAESLEPKMTIAVHDPSNSLIVTAPDQLYNEVEQLAKQIDLRSKRTIEILKVDPGLALELQEMFSDEQGSSSTSRSPVTPKSSLKR